MSNVRILPAGTQPDVPGPALSAQPQTLQHPINSGFGPASTADDVVKGHSLVGKNVIVTGGSSGLGRETARALASAGARVIIAARDVTRAAQSMHGVPGIEIALLDLLDPVSIDAFAAGFIDRGLPLHLLVGSAGIMAGPLTRDRRGFEQQFSTNHLGHFQLTVRLWSALRRARGARVISVASRGHWFSPVDFEDPNFQHRQYGPWLGYGQSKTANILFAVEMDRRGREQNVRSFAVHPGSIVETGLARNVTLDLLRQAGAVDEHGQVIIDPSNGLKTPAQGASTIVWCAISPRLEDAGGVYCEDNDIATINVEEPAHAMPTAATVSRKGVKPYAIDAANARQLWLLSERLLGIQANF